MCQIKSIKSPVHVNYHSQAKELCRRLLPDPWASATNDQIKCSRIKVGRSNRLFVCRLKGSTEDGVKFRNKVIVRFYGSELTGQGNRYKSVSDETEIQLLEKLSAQGMAPKVLATFDGGRIDEYIESSLVTLDQLRSIPVARLLAEKISRFHNLDTTSLPASLNLYQTVREMLQQSIKLAETFDDTHLSLEQSVLWDQVKNFLLNEPTDFVFTSANYLKQRQVFAHSDLNPTNFLVLNGESNDNKMDQNPKDIMIIDIENCQKAYRGMDLGKFFAEMSIGMDNKKDSYFVSDVIIEEFIHEYLHHWQKISTDFDSRLDSPENLLVEIKLGLLFNLIAHITWNVLHPNFTNIEILESSITRINVYYHFKQRWLDN